eukprot:m.99622 g.99622  ORF g.99622 m.99622 type:complete len:592 (+) comp10313_c0_seq4:341-2116(+)
MSHAGAAEPWSEGSEPESDEGDHIDARRQYWRELRAGTTASHRQDGAAASTKPTLCVTCVKPLAARGQRAAGQKASSTSTQSSPTRRASSSRAGTTTSSPTRRSSRVATTTLQRAMDRDRDGGSKAAAGRPLECPDCRGKLSAVYCSKKCLEEDAHRHRDECRAVTQDEDLLETVSDFRAGPDIADDTDTYNVGEHADRQLTVRRWLPSADTTHPAPAHIDACDNPVAAWKQQYNPEAMTCSRPWVSFGTPTAVTVTWVPPVRLGRYPTVGYDLQLRHRPHSEAVPSPWQPCDEPHTGRVPSHIVNGLTCGTWVEFRVKLVVPASSAAHFPGLPIGDDVGYSPTSVSFRVGYADTTAVTPPVDQRNKGPSVPPGDFSEDEIRFFMTLKTPALVQDYLDSIPMNHEIQDDTCLSALESVRQNHAHCIEGAMLGAYILSLHGHAPYLMDLRACAADDDHIVTPFRIGRRWGCLSVSNHASLRFRNPVYRTLREMIMSYFDDYMNGKGERTLRAYSQPVHLAAVFGPKWHARRGDVYEIAEFVDTVKHYRLIDDTILEHLRPADEMVLATTVHQREWQAPDNFDEEQVRRNENK